MKPPKNYKHIMVDIETMGPAPDGALIAIGAVPFNLHPKCMELAPESKWFHERCTLEANILANRKIDAETVEWWMRQTKTAQEMVLAEPRVQHFATFIYDFEEWIRDTRAEFIWAKPPEFDIDILKHAFAGTAAEWPFGGRATRDVRTVLAQAKFNNREDVFNLPFEGEKHNAVHDAAHQARQVILAYE